ncbi:related to nicotinamide mononucleotide permease [Fusarium fujikuroi]|nr:related to nicotinamide mononucleotide permease [Fusarium fujikuroi]
MATVASQHESQVDTPTAKTGVEESQSEIPICDWTEKAETKLRRKIDFTILPMLMLGLFALQLDRGNVGYAMTTSFTEDLGINNDNVNTGNQLMLAAVVIFEIPFNMVLSKIGPALWLIVQILAWGTIATAQAAVHNKPGFYATRFLLGMWEAGYLAAALTILASFYTRKEMAMRATLVYVGNYCSAGVSGLLAGLIFRIPETSGLKKWQWLFIIDGLFTLVVGFVFILIMPRSTTNTLPLAGLKWFDLFNAEERDILAKRVIIDDPRKHVKLSGISPKTALRILLTSFPMWGHFGINVISITPKGGLVFYTPTIIKNLGFGASTASFLAAVSNFGVCILAILVSWVSDKTLYRGPLCLLCGVYSLVFSGVQFAVVGSSDVWMKYAILTLLGSGVAVSQSLNDAWFSINTEDPQVRCIGLALAVAGSNVGGLAGQNIFVKSDAPYYRNGFLKILCLYAASIVLVAGMIFYYWNDNRRMEKSGELEEATGTEGSGGVKKRRVKNQL